MPKRTLYNIALIVVTLSLILGVTLLLDKAEPPQAQALPPEVSVFKSQSAPDFEFSVFDTNQKKSLSEFRGKVVLLNFWASWCAPCVIEFPKLATLAKENPDTLVVIAVSADSDRNDISRFLKKANHKPAPNFLLVHDEGKTISQDLFQTIRLPETIIIDPDGNMVRKVIGDTDWTGNEMKSYLSSLVKASSIP